MTEDENAQEQARAERLADLVKSPDLREKLLTLAREWREIAWETAANVAPEPRIIPSGHSDTWAPDEVEPPSPRAPGAPPKASR